MRDRFALASFVLPVASCLVVLVAIRIAISLIVKKALKVAKKKPAQTAPSGESESPEASIEPPDEEQGDIALSALLAQPRVRPPTRLSRTPTHKMTPEQHATFASAIDMVRSEGHAAANSA